MVFFFVKSNENTYPKRRALVQMYRVVPITKRGNKLRCILETIVSENYPISFVCNNSLDRVSIFIEKQWFIIIFVFFSFAVVDDFITVSAAVSVTVEVINVAVVVVIVAVAFVIAATIVLVPVFRITEMKVRNVYKHTLKLVC